MARRWERLERKYKNQLRCENCNRWTPVEADTYDEASNNSSAIFLCDRDRCKGSRPETLLPKGRRIKIYKENTYKPARLEAEQKDWKPRSANNSQSAGR